MEAIRSILGFLSSVGIYVAEVSSAFIRSDLFAGVVGALVVIVLITVVAKVSSKALVLLVAGFVAFCLIFYPLVNKYFVGYEAAEEEVYRSFDEILEMNPFSK